MSVLKQYQIDATSATSIALSLERAIERSRLREGDPLPTIRSLASELGVSPTTVNAAYALLRRRGLIDANRRGGSRVRARSEFHAPAVPRVAPDLRNLAVANPDPAFLPDIGKALASAASAPSMYGESQNVPELIETAQHLFEKDGVPDGCIAVANGALDAIERALHAHTRPGDAIALEDPAYPPYAALAQTLGLRIVPMRMDECGVLPDALERALKERVNALIVIPRAQNPTGASFDRTRAAALKRLLRDAPEVLVIEDDYLSEISGTPLFSLCDSRTTHWVSIRSVSKLFGPDLRLSIVAGDATTIGRIQARQQLGSGWVSRFTQRAVASFFNDDRIVRRLRDAAQTYAGRRQALIAALRSEGISAMGASGFNVWIPMREESGALRALQSAGWAVDAGERYRFESPPALRVTVTTLQPAEAAKFAKDLQRALRPASGTLLP